MDRRTFLKIIGWGSLSIAAGCSPDDKTLYSLVEAPDDMVTGKATWYASTCRECPAGCGVLAKNREGRVIKLEGNPFHPINLGKLCMRGQSALQGIYNPDRIITPLLKEHDSWRTISYLQAQEILTTKAREAASNGENRVRMLTEVVGDSLQALFEQCLSAWQSVPPLMYEPFAYESLKTANRKTFGVNGLPSYRMEDTDVLVSFGADFLETWLSPVEYARKFKNMHGLRDSEKGRFFQISSYQSLTATNADVWLSCNPGSEGLVALGMIREALELGKGKWLGESLRSSLVRITSSYTMERVVQRSGINAESYQRTLNALLSAQKPLILGTGNVTGGDYSLQTDSAANLLNIIFDPELTLFDFEQRHRVERAAAQADVSAFFNTLKMNEIELLLLNNINPVYSFPTENVLRETLKSDNLFVVSFADFMDETTSLADLIIPVRMPLETWDEYGGKNGLISTLQPAMGRLTDAPFLGDVLLKAAFGESEQTYQEFLVDYLGAKNNIATEQDWIETIQRGGRFADDPVTSPRKSLAYQSIDTDDLEDLFNPIHDYQPAELTILAVPSLRFFDGRGANKPWLCEVPDPLTMVAWLTPVVMHPELFAAKGLQEGDIVRVETNYGRLEGPAYESVGVNPNVVTVAIGQGHEAYGRYADGVE